MLTKISETILNLFFPPRCAFCSEIINWIPMPKHMLCEECLSKISFINMKACKYCGKQLKTDTGRVCPQCTGGKYYSEVFSSCEYSGLIRDKLLEYKFKGNKQLYKVFASFIIDKLKMTNQAGFDIIISVPLHLSKLEERGYNQSELIAKEIAQYFSISLSINNLVKSKQTESQSKLDKKGRGINVKGAFCISDNHEVIGKRVLLVDDIITTGTTVNECSKVLLQAGAEEVYVVTVATGIIDTD